MITEASRFLAFSGQIPPLLIVGIGYGGATGMRDMMKLRNYELTPTVDEAYIERATAQGQDLGPMGLGGAPGFLKFIEEELAPVIEETYGADPTDRGLFGFSLGGLFTTWAMLRPSTGFRRFIAGSPSLWWDKRVMFEIEAERAVESRELGAQAFISAGELEEHPSNRPLTAFRMVSNVVEFAGSLARREYEGLTLDLEIVRGVGHEQAPMIVQGLRSVYGNAS
jgi:predicted alpha/beta superfamily hydrolase